MTRALGSIRPHHVDRLRAIVARHLGLAFDETKTTLLEDVLQRRARQADQSVEGFLASLEVGAPRQLRALAPELTVGETYFFRNAEQFRAFAEAVLPGRMRARRSRPAAAGAVGGLRFGRGGLLARDPAARAPARSRLAGDLVAVDVNPVALERAARGAVLGLGAARDAAGHRAPLVPGGGPRAGPDRRARARVTFAERNLIDDDAQLWAPEAYDVVFCRNVLMYFTPEGARERRRCASVGRSLRAATSSWATPRRCAGCRTTFTSATPTARSTTSAATRPAPRRSVALPSRHRGPRAATRRGHLGRARSRAPRPASRPSRRRDAGRPRLRRPPRRRRARTSDRRSSCCSRSASPRRSTTSRRSRRTPRPIPTRCSCTPCCSPTPAASPRPRRRARGCSPSTR